MLLPAAITQVRQISILYPSIDCNVQYSSIAIAHMGLQSLSEITFFPHPTSNSNAKDKR